MEVNIPNYIAKSIAQMVTAIANLHGFKDYREPVSKRFTETFDERYEEILKKVQADSKDADFADGLSHGKIHQLVKSTFKVSIAYECMVYAKELLTHCGFTIPQELK